MLREPDVRKNTCTSALSELLFQLEQVPDLSLALSLTPKSLITKLVTWHSLVKSQGPLLCVGLPDVLFATLALLLLTLVLGSSAACWSQLSRTNNACCINVPPTLTVSADWLPPPLLSAVPGTHPINLHGFAPSVG